MALQDIDSLHFSRYIELLIVESRKVSHRKPAKFETLNGFYYLVKFLKIQSLAME